MQQGREWRKLRPPLAATNRCQKRDRSALWQAFRRIRQALFGLGWILALIRGVDPNVPSGAVSIANCLILWDFKNHELRSKRAIFSTR
jgi:hypothetical protein